MRKVIILLLVTLTTCISLYAKSYCDIWHNEEDRSASEFVLWTEDTNLLIQPNFDFEAITVRIADATGTNYYTDIIVVPTGSTYAISVAELPKGEYNVWLSVGAEMVEKAILYVY